MTEGIVHHPGTTAQQLETDGFFKLVRHDGLNLRDLLFYFHRGEPDGWIRFATIGDPFIDRGELQVTTLRGEGDQAFLPGFIDALTYDGVQSLNPHYRSGRRTTPPPPKWRTVQDHDPKWDRLAADFPGAQIQDEPAPTPHRRIIPGLAPPNYNAAAEVRWLNTAWVDCDDPTAFTGIQAAAAAGTIPRPSFIHFSGHGAWAFWQLRDERNPIDGTIRLHGAQHNADTPPRASSRAVSLHQRINAALAARLRHLKSDAGSGDVGRLCRIPGTVNTKTDRIVVVTALLDTATGEMATYTLPELAEWLRIDDSPAATRRHVKKDPTPAQLAQRLNAKLSGARKKFASLQALSERRHGIEQGNRNLALHWLVQMGTLAALDLGTLTAAAERFGTICRPPLKDREIRSNLRSGQKRARDIAQRRPLAPGKPPTLPVGYAAIVRTLQATTEEITACGLHRNAPYQPSMKRALREATILGLLGKLTAIPSTTDMAQHLQALGLQASQQTVNRDYERLGLRSGLKGGGDRRLKLPF